MSIILFEPFFGAREERPCARWAAEAPPPTTRSPHHKTLSDHPCLAFTRRLSWGFQRTPLHRSGLSSSTPTQILQNFRSGSSSLRPVLARERVLFRLRGFPPPWRFPPSRVPRVCCTPQPIMGFAALRIRLVDAEAFSSPLLPRRLTLRSISTSVAVQRVSTLLLDSFPPAVHHPKMARLQGFTPRNGFTKTPPALPLWVPYNFLGFLPHPSPELPNSSKLQTEGCSGDAKVAFREPGLETSQGREHGTSSNQKRLATFGFSTGSPARNNLPGPFLCLDHPRSALGASTSKEAVSGGSCPSVRFLPQGEGAVDGGTVTKTSVQMPKGRDETPPRIAGLSTEQGRCPVSNHRSHSYEPKGSLPMFFQTRADTGPAHVRNRKQLSFRGALSDSCPTRPETGNIAQESKRHLLLRPVP